MHLDEVPYRSEIWKNRYPELYYILDGDPKLPLGNRFEYNTVVGGVGLLVSDREGFADYLSIKGNTHKKIALVGIKEIPITEVTRPIDINKDSD